VENGILFIKPTLTVDRYGDNFLKNGYLDLIEEGCDPKVADQRCILYVHNSIYAYLKTLYEDCIVLAYSYTYIDMQNV